MFRKILIANRGEIACRIAATARLMGVATVSVYSDADATAAHVAAADEAVRIGPPQPAESYLKGKTIIDAALATGAEAIHPGYGFLSENPGFVDQVDAAGLTFIGPSAQAIRAMGLKDAAKALMEEAGVPVVPGFHGADQDPGHLEVEASVIGYPVLIKAVAGGGGKGMRRVAVPGDFMNELESAKAEALGAFGNDAVLIEKYVEKPRHIEVQVFGDGDRAVHLFERDCSLQRRHQKVIEEAPAPGMTAEMRDAMGQAAVRAAEAIGYRGAGTVEFIVDGSDGLRPDRFYFMEMNTRLQVEHPVTEAITGIDLVEWQLRVASGEPLPLEQGDISLSGHAFEARLYAEDVPKGFLPATGTLAHLRFPDGVRADSGVRSGDTITPYYDPMIAKLVVHGPTRRAALSRLDRALRETEVAGTVTNLAFLGALTRHAGFAAGDVDTGLIDRDLTQLASPPEPSSTVRAMAAVAALDLHLPADWARGFSLWSPLCRTVRLHGPDGAFAARVTVLGPTALTVELDGARHSIRTGPGLSVDGKTVGHRPKRIGGIVYISGDCGAEFTIEDPLDQAADAAGDTSVVVAPMPGLVRAVLVHAGQTVEKGARLAILEAMKMEHVLAAPRDGAIGEVLTAEGSQVEAGAALIRLQAEGEA